MPEFINSFFIIWCGFILYILFEIHMPCYVKKRKITVNEEKRLQEYIKKLENKGGRMQNKISD